MKWVLNFQLLYEINTMFKGKKKRIREWVWKNKTKKERQEKDRKYFFMREFRCKNEKTAKKNMGKNNAKNDFLLLLFYFL